MISLIYINLDRDIERRRHFEVNFDLPDLSLTRISAFTPSTIPSDIAQRFRADFLLVPGEIGCFASHIAAWEQVASSQNNWYIICEDDAVIQAYAHDLINLLSVVNVENPFVQLCGTVKSSSLRLVTYKELRLIRPLFSIMNATAYALRPETARTLLNDAFEIGLPVDGFVRKYGRINLNMLAIAPAPFNVVEFPTTISEGVSRGKRSKPPFKGSRFSVFREVKFIFKFGFFGFLRVFAAYLLMKSLRIKKDNSGRFEVSA